MTEKVVLVQNREEIYELPLEVCEKYSLSGDKVEAARTALEETYGDVVG